MALTEIGSDVVPPPPADPSPPPLVEAVPLPAGTLLLWGTRRRVFALCGVVRGGRVLPGVVKTWVRTTTGAWSAQVEHQDPDGPEGAVVTVHYLAGPGLAPARPVLLYVVDRGDR